MEFASLRVELPYNESLKWKRLQALYKSLHNIKDTKTLLSTLLEIFKSSGHEASDASTGVQGEQNLFSGLGIFLDDIATSKEKTSFFQTILPVIVSLASLLDKFAPSTRLHRSCRLKDFKVLLSKNFIGSLLASSFLCAIPPCTTNIDFIQLYDNIQRPAFKDRAVANLRRFLQYFERIASSEGVMTGDTIFERQVVTSSSLPSNEYWETSDAIMCPVVVEQQKLKHDFLTGFGKVDICGHFHCQDNLDGSIEALVAAMFVDELEDNEVLVIKHDNDINSHVERLINCTPPPINDVMADSPRDLVMRYLNKAVVCFDSHGSICELINSVDDRQDDDDDGIQYIIDEDTASEERPEHDDDGIQYISDEDPASEERPEHDDDGIRYNSDEDPASEERPEHDDDGIQYISDEDPASKERPQHDDDGIQYISDEDPAGEERPQHDDDGIQYISDEDPASEERPEHDDDGIQYISDEDPASEERPEHNDDGIQYISDEDPAGEERPEHDDDGIQYISDEDLTSEERPEHDDDGIQYISDEDPASEERPEHNDDGIQYISDEDPTSEERPEHDDDGIQYIIDEDLASEERPKHNEVIDLNGNITIPGIDTFCLSLVGQAYDKARGEIDISSTIPSEDRRDIFEDLMKKSLHEVFQKTPEKEKIFSDSIIDSALLPKCLLHFHSNGGLTSPLVPSTPPSSPVKRGLVANGRQSPRLSLSPLVDELRLGTKSFADSLAEALMSCVLLSSSLAASIATEALDPLSITSVTMEMFQKSPNKILNGQNGGIFSSKFPSHENNRDKNVYNDTSFCLFTNKLDSELIDVSSDSLSIDSDDDHEARRQSLNELALNLFDNFASKLSSSIIDTATRVIIGDAALESIDEETGIELDKNEVAVESIDIDMYERQPKDYDKSVSDSDSDSEGHWYGMDIDKVLEDQLYELDLTDNEEYSIESQRSLSDMADDMMASVLRTAVSEAARDLDSKEETSTQDVEEEYGITYEEETTQESLENDDFMEQPDTEHIEVFASDISINIIQDVLEGFRYDGDISSQNGNEFHSTLTEIDESVDIDGCDVSSVSSNQQSAELIQYVEVLTEQLIETSVAIASTACSNYLHPIATSRWCSEESGVDVQMEAILQWLAASAVGCPAIVFHTMWDTRLEKFSTVYHTLRENHYRVCDVLDIVLCYIQSDSSDTSCNLFEFLLESLG